MIEWGPCRASTLRHVALDLPCIGGDRFDEAITKGNLIRFLEQSIEWTQLQYAFYPYYWARKETWEDRVRKDDADYEFQQFMQAGAARVVLAVRPLGLFGRPA